MIVTLLRSEKCALNVSRVDPPVEAHHDGVVLLERGVEQTLHFPVRPERLANVPCESVLRNHLDWLEPIDIFRRVEHPVAAGYEGRGERKSARVSGSAPALRDKHARAARLAPAVGSATR